MNVCLYHGEKTPYPHSTDLFECFSDPDLAREYGFKPFYLIDLTILSDEEIDRQGKAALMEYLLKHCRNMELFRNIKKLATFLRDLEDDFYLQNVLYYLGEACGNQGDAHEFFELLSQELPEEKEAIMTFGQQLRQEGRQQGRQEGLEQGLEQGIQKERFAIAKSLLVKNFEPAMIVELTGLSLSAILQIKKEIQH